MNPFAQFLFLAQTTQPTPGWVDAVRNPVFLIAIMMVVLYFFTSRSKRTQEKSRKDMLAQLKRGDRIQTIGGVLGKVVDVEEGKVLVKVDESSNTKIWFSRSAIHRVETDEKEVVKA